MPAILFSSVKIYPLLVGKERSCRRNLKLQSFDQVFFLCGWNGRGGRVSSASWIYYAVGLVSVDDE